jgi:hypothetical protein
MAGGAMQGPAPTMSNRLDNCTHESHRENILGLLARRLGPTTQRVREFGWPLIKTGLFITVQLGLIVVSYS